MTLAEIETDLLDYADFEESGSVSRARSFATAAKRWLILRADSAASQSQSMSIGKQFVENMLTRANAYIAKNTAGGQVRFLHVGGTFR